MMLWLFGWAYYILSPYAPGVFFITVLVGLVYGELGFAMGPLVELRIEEVPVGCLVSFAVAILMMPLAATRHVETWRGAVLGALREVVRLVRARDGRAPEAASAMRKLDRGWHDLRIALKPLQTQRVGCLFTHNMTPMSMTNVFIWQHQRNCRDQSVFPHHLKQCSANK
ncbi:hypothetical protein LMG28614_06450 [Paraburkholderia ultramafica]|uniref:Uncharacterized protein n=2 Tax=Paraburkholderia ultramafica TaxID=1544867 RepID=A0A6S7BPL3_9BURK|nr:hypothetical protein LMG28614_06450 [Paraburkholderia ultramafica]